METETHELEGTISRITFYAEDTGYAIFRLKPEDSALPLSLTVVGLLPNPTEGVQIRASGHWTTHPKYGKQFKAEEIQELLPKTQDGIRAFLGSGLIKGIGPKTAEKIVNTFGDETLAVLEQHPERLRGITGFSKKKVDLVIEGWQKYRAIREVMMFLQSQGITTAYAFRIFKAYGAECVNVLKENPYRLADEVWGIGFKLADRIAHNMGIQTDDPKRIRSGILYILQQTANSGHTYVMQAEMIQTAEALLGVETLQVEQVIPDMIKSGDLYDLDVLGEDALALKKYYLIEQSLHLLLQKHQGVQLKHKKDWQKNCETWLDQYKQKKLTDEQRQAVLTISQSPMSILTGGPGCGKTTTLHALVQMYKKFGKKVFCCAPTGRASRRMEEVIRVPSKTIHRMLEYDPKNNEFVRNEQFPLQGDCLIVDETSMVDVELGLALLRAVPKHMQVVWVGDKDQLPSVGPGRLLGDMIDLQMCAVATLTRIFRQGGRSQIVVNAHRVNEGEFPYLFSKEKGEDFFYIEKPTPEAIQAAVLDCVLHRINKAFNIQPADIRVLTPMHKGLVGTMALNQVLQEKLNPNVSGKHFLTGAMGRKFFEGDAVLQKVNNYQLNLMNGELGVIQSLNTKDQEAVIRFDHRDVVCDIGDLQDMELGYAMSIHKSQGSEFPAVIIPIHESQFIMLHRTLLYTAITRARKLCVLIGTKRAIAIGIKRTEHGHRKTLMPLFAT